jgi:hypothetical protein
MKRSLAFLSLLLLATWAYPTDFKIMAGLSFSKSSEPMFHQGDIVFLFPPYAEFGAGFIAGGGIEFSLARNVVLEADALFFQKGSRIGLEEQIGTAMARISELSIPILIKVLLKPGTSPYILGGGEFGFVLTDGRTKSVDYGLLGGVGYRMRLKKSAMSLEARYHYGFQDMLPADVVLGYGVRKMRAFSFMLGFSI